MDDVADLVKKIETVVAPFQLGEFGYFTRLVSNMPVAPNSALGSHAPIAGGINCPLASAKPSGCKTKYARQIKMLAATPMKTLRRPDAAPNGMAISATIIHVHGCARRACRCVSIMARSRVFSSRWFLM